VSWPWVKPYVTSQTSGYLRQQTVLGPRMYTGLQWYTASSLEVITVASPPENRANGKSYITSQTSWLPRLQHWVRAMNGKVPDLWDE
jgi:hypothetical protein